MCTQQVKRECSPHFFSVKKKWKYSIPKKLNLFLTFYFLNLLYVIFYGDSKNPTFRYHFPTKNQWKLHFSAFFYVFLKMMYCVQTFRESGPNLFDSEFFSASDRIFKIWAKVSGQKFASTSKCGRRCATVHRSLVRIQTIVNFF